MNPARLPQAPHPSPRLILAVLVLLSGCATTAPPTQYRNAAHPEYGQTDIDRDWYECRRENTHPAAQSSSYRVPYSAGSESSASMVVNEDMARACFAARGWHPVTSGTIGFPATPAASSSAPTVEGARYARPNPIETERFQKLAREQLAKPYTGAPFACTDGGWWSVKNYVVDVAPWAEAAGLRRGDRMITFGEISLAQYDAQSDAWSKVPRSENIMVRVERAGQEVSIQLPCRDDAEAWHARVAVWQAVTDGQWQACVDGIQAYVKATRMTSASVLSLAGGCIRERAKAAAQPLPDEFWRTFHAWATKAIEEAHYRPTGLTEIRSGLLNAADALEKAGRSTWATDIRQQIATFETSSRP